MKNLKLKPYNGPAGPTEKQTQHNNKVLGQELKKLNIPYEEDREFLKELTGIEQPLLKITHPITKDHIYAGYDRWGFVILDYLPRDIYDHLKSLLFDCLNGDDEDTDQVSLETATSVIKKWYNMQPQT